MFIVNVIVYKQITHFTLNVAVKDIDLGEIIVCIKWLYQNLRINNQDFNWAVSKTSFFHQSIEYFRLIKIKKPQVHFIIEIIFIENEGILHSWSIRSVFYDKMDRRLFYFDEAIFLEFQILQERKLLSCLFENIWKWWRITEPNDLLWYLWPLDTYR